MDILIAVFFVFSCIINGIYYFWVTLLSLLPKSPLPQNERYSGKNDLFFFLLMPCLNEGKVVSATVKDLLSLKMRNTKVIVINDGSDDNTLQKLRRIHDDNLVVVNRVPPNAKEGKGMALNDGYHMVRSIADQQGIDHSKVIVGVLDADTFIRRGLLRRVAAMMKNDPQIGMVQARVRIGIATRNKFLPKLQDLEFFTIINRMQNVREYTGSVAAAGNGQFNRLSAMEALGDRPWGQCLLEDFDFSLRLLLSGWRTCLLQDENIYQQGVVRYQKFVRQRARWTQGCIQCFPYIRAVIRSACLSSAGKIEIVFFLFLPWLTLLSSVTLLFSWMLILYAYLCDASVLPFLLGSYSAAGLTALLIAVLLFMYLPGFIFAFFYKRDTGESFVHTLLIALMIPVYNVMQIPSVLLAVYRQVFGNYGWVKTDRV